MSARDGERACDGATLDGALLLLAARFCSGGVQAGDAIIPHGQLKGWALDDLRRLPARADAVAWLRWALAVLSGYWPSDFELALLSFASEHFPRAPSPAAARGAVVARERPRVVRWRDAIVSSDLPASRRHVALTLSLHMDKDGGSCFPSIKTIARETGLSPSTVKVALNELEQRELILRVRGGGEGHPTRYSAVLLNAQTGRPSASLEVDTGRLGDETGRPPTSDRPTTGPEGSSSRKGTSARANSPSTERHARANGKSEIATTWQRFLNGHGWDDSYTEDMILDELRRQHESLRTHGELDDQAALDQWRAQRDRRYPPEPHISVLRVDPDLAQETRT